MWTLAFVAYIGFILGVLAQDQDAVIRVNQGERLEIIVAFPNNPNPSQCAYNNKLFGPIVENDEHYQVLVENGHCKLIITRVTFKKDRGVWICSVGNGPEFKKTILVEVSIPSSEFPDQDANDENLILYNENHQEAQEQDLVIRVNEGERVEINVAFPSNPNPSQCAWSNTMKQFLHNDDDYQTMIENGRCKLIIAHVNFRRDNGIWECYSGNGKRERKRIDVQVSKFSSYKIYW